VDQRNNGPKTDVRTTCEMISLFVEQITNPDLKKTWIDFDTCYDAASRMFEKSGYKGVTGIPLLKLIYSILVDLGSNDRHLPEAVMVEVDRFRTMLDKATSKVLPIEKFSGNVLYSSLGSTRKSKIC